MVKRVNKANQELKVNMVVKLVNMVNKANQELKVNSTDKLVNRAIREFNQVRLLNREDSSTANQLLKLASSKVKAHNNMVRLVKLVKTANNMARVTNKEINRPQLKVIKHLTVSKSKLIECSQFLI